MKIIKYILCINFHILAFCYQFSKETYLWSISKQKWINGPNLPHLLGVEEGCMTLLNKTVVMVIGFTNLESNLEM